MKTVFGPCGVAHKIHFQAVTPAGAVYAGGFIAGECQHSNDGIAFINTTNLPVYLANGVYSLQMTALEMLVTDYLEITAVNAAAVPVSVTITVSVKLGNIAVDASIRGSEGVFVFAGGNFNAVRLEGNLAGAGLACAGGATGHAIEAIAGGSGCGIYSEGKDTFPGIHARNIAGGGAGLFASGAQGLRCVGSDGGIFANSTGGDSHGFYSGGAGSGSGIVGSGGASSGHGIYGQGFGSSDGFRAIGTGTGSGIQGLGSGIGYGISGIGGATGHGMSLAGGSTSGHGVQANATGGDSHGFYSGGVGSGSGIVGSGGASGHGIYGQGFGSSDGFRAIGAGTGSGIKGLGTGVGHGIAATGGATGHGMSLTGGSTSGHGLISTGVGTGIGIVGTGASPTYFNNIFEQSESTEPTGALAAVASYRQIFQWLKRRWNNKHLVSGSNLVVMKDDSVTPVSTQTVSSDGLTIGKTT